MRDSALLELDETVGEYRIVVVRHGGMFHLNGYIGLPLHDERYGDDYDSFDVPVHGGWTYCGNECPGIDEGDRWWFGFDTAHLGDAVDEEWVKATFGDESRELSFVRRLNDENGHRWKVDEVREELLRVVERINQYN